MARIISYILVQLAPGRANKAAKAISSIPSVKMAHAVTGPFDVIAFADVPDLAALSELVLSKVQNVKGVEKTQTAVVVAPGPAPLAVADDRSRKALTERKQRH